MSTMDRITDKSESLNYGLIYRRIDLQFNPEGAEEESLVNLTEAREIWSLMNEMSAPDADKFVTRGLNTGLLLSSDEVRRVAPNKKVSELAVHKGILWLEKWDCRTLELTETGTTYVLMSQSSAKRRVGSDCAPFYTDSEHVAYKRQDPLVKESPLVSVTIRHSEALHGNKYLTVESLGDTITLYLPLDTEIESRKLDTMANAEYYGLIVWNKKSYGPKLDGYHNNVSRGDKSKQYKVVQKRKYLIGVEIEKECQRIRDRISAPYLRDRYGWTAERDGSLGSGGYELISPTYDLFDRKGIKKDLLSLRDYIDCPVLSSNAGGHINVSFEGMNTGLELFNEIEGYAALLYAMYPDRTENGYSRAKSKDRYRHNPGKDAFYIKDNRLEIRIFPEVKNVECMLQRIELIRYMVRFATKRTDVVASRLFNPKSNLRKLIIKMGYDPVVLATLMMKAAHKVDSERFTLPVHEKLKAHGVTLSSMPLYTKKQMKVVEAKIIKWSSTLPDCLSPHDVESILSVTRRSVARLSSND